MEYYGYAGNILYIDLTSGKIEKEPLDINIANKLIGGAGVNYKLAYDLIKPGEDPFSPDSPIIIGAGLFTGTLVPSASKIQVTHKCPLMAVKMVGITLQQRLPAVISLAPC